MKKAAAFLLACITALNLLACGAEKATPEAAMTAPAAETAVPTLTPAPETPAEETAASPYVNGQAISLDPGWQYADLSVIHTGSAVMYLAAENRKNIIIGVNAGHGTEGGTSVRSQSHPDGSAKTTGGSTAAGSTTSYAVSVGMTFADGTPEAEVTLRMAQLLRDRLLAAGYDVLMLRDGEDVQLDNVARTVLCNNIADCHISIHWDGDELSYDKGVFYCSVPDAMKTTEPVASVWQESDALGRSLVTALSGAGFALYNDGAMTVDLTQTAYSTVPSVDIELGNENSDHSDAALALLADALLTGVNAYFGE